MNFKKINEWLDDVFKNNSNMYGNLTVVMFMGMLLIPFIGLYAIVVQFGYLALRWGRYK